MSSLPLSSQSQKKISPSPLYLTLLTDITITQHEIGDIINSLDEKTIGCDTVSHHMLKGADLSIRKPLYVLFNYSLTTKTFPNIQTI